MTRFLTLASGSSGNAALLSCGDTHLLIDMGISCRRICQELARLGLQPGDLTAILVTHEHTDHVGGLATYVKKYRTPILATPGTARQLSYRIAGIEPLLCPVPLGQCRDFPGMRVMFLPTSHDCAESAAFRVEMSEGTLGYLTDTGVIPPETGRALLGASLLVLESNHDVDWLLSGRYPYRLKQRVLGQQGHLSNDAAADFAARSAGQGTRQIILAHLSNENNTPQRALETVGCALAGVGYTGGLWAAPGDGAGKIYIMEAAVCSE